MFSQPVELPVHIFQTKLDIATSFLYEKQKWIIETSTQKNPDNNIIVEIDVSQVETYYKRAPFPTVRKNTVKSLLNASKNENK